MKPTETPVWSTDPGTRSAPVSGALATGWNYGETPPPKWMNWLLGLLCDWVAYFAAAVPKIQAPRQFVGIECQMGNRPVFDRDHGLWVAFVDVSASLSARYSSNGYDFTLGTMTEDAGYVPVSIASDGTGTTVVALVNGSDALSVHSTTDGKTWAARTLTVGSPTGHANTRVVWDPSSSRFLLLYTNGFDVSSDGETWTAFGGASPTYRWRLAVSSDGQSMIASGGFFFSYSINGGTSWGFFDHGMNIRDVAYDATRDVFLLVCDNGGVPTVLELDPSAPTTIAATRVPALHAATAFGRSLSIDGYLLVVQGTTLWVSGDAGATFDAAWGAIADADADIFEMGGPVGMISVVSAQIMAYVSGHVS